jgi:hypothetical protein
LLKQRQAVLLPRVALQPVQVQVRLLLRLLVVCLSPQLLWASLLRRWLLLLPPLILRLGRLGRLGRNKPARLKPEIAPLGAIFL